MIEQFIHTAMQQLNVSQTDAEQATSGLLSLLQGQSKGTDFTALLSQIGGAEQLMHKYDAGNNLGASSGGLMGSLFGAATSMLGKDSTAGKAAALAALVSQINLDSGQLSQLMTLFFNYAKEQAGPALAENLMAGLTNFAASKAA